MTVAQLKELDADALSLAFLNRSSDDAFADVGHRVSSKPLTDIEAVWEGYEYLKYE